MAGITKRERQDKARIAEITKALADPTLPRYIFAKLQGTLSSLQRTQDKRLAARQTALDVKRKAAAPVVRYNVLPDNNRGPSPEWLKKHGRRQALPAVNAALLPRAGETPAETRARLEKLAAE
jgi:hypothetical protein